MTSIIYTPKDIYEQDFKTSMRGYDKREVDEFLDDVIKDYENYIKQIQNLKDEIAALKAIEKPKTQANFGIPTPPKASVASVPPVPPTSPSSMVPPMTHSQEVVNPIPSATNLDILKRISRLEKEVFGKQIVE